MFTALALSLALAGVALPTVDAVRGLEPDSAPHPVWLRGTVTYLDPARHDFYLQDATGGVRVRADRLLESLAVGDAVAIEGVTARGEQSVQVRAARVARLGPADPPQPATFDLSLAAADWLDGQVVNAHAIVRAVSHGDGFTRLKLHAPGGEAVAVVPGPPGAAAAQWVGAVVSVRGVCVTAFDDQRKVARTPHILVPAADCISLSEWVSMPVQRVPAAEVARRATPIGDPRMPVAVTGVVTAAWGRRVVFVQDATGGVCAVLAEPGEVGIGAWVEVTGLPVSGGGAAQLEYARLRPAAAAGAAPESRPATPADLIGGRFDGLLVRVEGQVVEVARTPGRLRVSVVGDRHPIDAYLEGDAALEGVAPGARVALLGVSSGRRVAGDPTGGAELILRGAADVTVLEAAPSWWRSRGAWYLMGGFVAAVGVGGAWVGLLRTRVRRAARQIERQFAEKARLEDRLRQAAKLEAVGRLAGGIAHDFNNLLTVINGCAEMLDEQLPGRDLVADIRQAGQRAAALTGQLLTFSRQRPVTLQPVDVNLVVRDTARLLTRVIGEDVAIRLVLGGDLPFARADAGLLSQVLVNLAVNARDAMPDGGIMTLSTERVAAEVETSNGADTSLGWVRLCITDTGYGMTEEVKARVFEPFFTTKELGKGTGLGLATVYGIVQTLGGRIRFDSAVGVGTQFDVEFPATLPVADPASDTPPPVAASDPGAVVLLVEDDDSVRTLSQRVLETTGATVLAADCPEEALRLSAERNGRLDVLVTDVMLPGMGGRELAEQVRAACPGVQVLFMSGYTPDEVLRRGVGDEEVAFLQKPFSPIELTDQLTRLLTRTAPAIGQPRSPTPHS